MSVLGKDIEKVRGANPPTKCACDAAKAAAKAKNAAEDKAKRQAAKAAKDVLVKAAKAAKGKGKGHLESSTRIGRGKGKQWGNNSAGRGKGKGRAGRAKGCGQGGGQSRDRENAWLAEQTAIDSDDSGGSLAQGWEAMRDPEGQLFFMDGDGKVQHERPTVEEDRGSCSDSESGSGSSSCDGKGNDGNGSNSAGDGSGSGDGRVSGAQSRGRAATRSVQNWRLRRLRLRMEHAQLDDSTGDERSEENDGGSIGGDSMECDLIIDDEELQPAHAQAPDWDPDATWTVKQIVECREVMWPLKAPQVGWRTGGYEYHVTWVENRPDGSPWPGPFWEPTKNILDKGMLVAYQNEQRGLGNYPPLQRWDAISKERLPDREPAGM